MASYQEALNFRGLTELVETLESLPKEFGSKNGGPTRKALAKAALLVKLETQKRVKVQSYRTGRLHDAIKAVRDRNPAKSGATERYVVGVFGGNRLKRYLTNVRNKRLRRAGKGYIVDNAYYWRFIEFGTSRRPAEPFLRPSIQQKANEAIQIFLVEFDSALTKAVNKAKKARL